MTGPILIVSKAEAACSESERVGSFLTRRWRKKDSNPRSPV